MAGRRQSGPGFQELRRQLSGGEALTVYCLEGEDLVRVRGVVDYLVKHQLGDGGAAFNLHVFDGDDCGLEAVMQQALSFPMMSPKQVVWVKRAEALCAGADEEQSFVGYLDKPSPETILILSSAKLDGRRRWVKKVKASGGYFDLSPPRGRDLMTWIERAAAERGLSLDHDTAALLVDLVGEDLSALGHELDKLTAAASDAGAVPAPDVLQRLILAQRPVDPFELLGSLGPGRGARGLQVLHRYLGEGRSVFELAPLLVWRVKQAAQVAMLLREGVGERQLPKVLGASPFAVKQAVEVVRTWGEDRVVHALTVIREFDQGLKSSPLSDEAQLERAILEICA